MVALATRLDKLQALLAAKAPPRRHVERLVLDEGYSPALLLGLQLERLEALAATDVILEVDDVDWILRVIIDPDMANPRPIENATWDRPKDRPSTPFVPMDNLPAEPRKDPRIEKRARLPYPRSNDNEI